MKAGVLAFLCVAFVLMTAVMGQGFGMMGMGGGGGGIFSMLIFLFVFIIIIRVLFQNDTVNPGHGGVVYSTGK